MSGQDSFLPTHYTVTTIVEGALVEDEECPNDLAACQYADVQASELRAEGAEDWQVYVKPHYCGGIHPAEGFSDGGTPYSDDELNECDCAQWLTDHHPYRSSDDLH